MASGSSAIAAIILFMILLLLLAFRLSLFLFKRAICELMEIFRQNNAVRIEMAATLEELGLADRPLFRLLRDYRPYAFQVLTQESIIQITPDGRFYLDEENPKANNIKCPTRGLIKHSIPFLRGTTFSGIRKKD